MTTAELTAAEIDELVVALRQGGSLHVGGSRCHTTYGFSEGAWYAEDFDEGATYPRPTTEQEIRALAREQVGSCTTVLRAHRWRDVRRAVAAGDRTAALAAVERWRRFGDGDVAAIVTAWLSPDTPLDLATREIVTRKSRDHSLHHLYLDLHDRPSDAGARGRAEAFVAELVERASATPSANT